jgi:soluble lytic murein transglycosylase-like protein
MGVDASKPRVSSALSNAASTARSFDYTSKDSAGRKHNKHVAIRLPDNLIKAIAWRESQWQSQIVSCDSGFGTMQIMRGTAMEMNNFFHTSYDYRTLTGNTQLGSEYLEWLVMRFGATYYKGNFNLSNSRLRADVIAAYNVGPGNVEQTPNGFPNRDYVAQVEELMVSQPWQN